MNLHKIETTLPVINPKGPKFLTKQITEEAVETRSILSEKKLTFLQEVEEKTKPQKKKLGSIWKLSEAKFASTGILSKLSKLFIDISEKKKTIILPVELVETLSQDFDCLTEDAVIEKREWQTNCYLDFQTRNKNEFFTAPPDVSLQAENQQALESVIKQNNKLSPKSTKKGEKKVRMSKETMNTAKSPERPHTARSIISTISIKSEASEDGKGSQVTTDYDRLPADLRPSILHYRRESTVPTIKGKPPQTRMEKMQKQLREKELQIKQAKG